MRNGDIVWFDFLPDQGTRVTIIFEHKGHVLGQDFNAALLSVWLGERPVTESLKREVLGVF